jgi:thymidylate synthase ThyX
MPTASELAKDYRLDPALSKKVEDLVTKVLASQTPVVEIIHFLFLLEHVPISLREQLVRHRVGHRFGPELGVDLIPELSDSSFWCQSMRSKDMGCFAADEAYQIPESILQYNESSEPAVYPDGGQRRVLPQKRKLSDDVKDHFEVTGNLYRHLVAAGIPPEDARCVIPLAATHRMIWSTNLAALKHVLKNRSCWLAQLGLWKPVIHGIVAILREISPLFGRLASPPCVNVQGWKGCSFPVDNVARCEGSDPGSPCPLWLQKEASGLNGHKHAAQMQSEAGTAYRKQYLQDLSEHVKLWGFRVEEIA